MNFAQQLRAAKAGGSNFSAQLKAAMAPERERRFAELGSLAAFLEAIETDLQRNIASMTGTGLLAAKRREAHERRAGELRAWAEQYERERPRELEDQPAIASIIEAWKEQYWEGEDPDVGTPYTVFDVNGEPDFNPADLRKFVESSGREGMRRDEADQRTQALRWHNANSDAGPPIKERERYIDGPRHWLIAFDKQTVAPVGIAGSALEAWAVEWRESIPSLRGSELAVYVASGQRVAFVTWWKNPKDASQARAWCDSISSDPDEPRFESLEPGRAWYAPGPGVYLPSAYATTETRSLRDRSHVDSTPTSAIVLDTAIPSLTKQFRGGGLPLGARVVIAGNTGQCKTTLALHLAEAACDQEWFVIWLAYDEARAEIEARRLQRRGLSPEAARTLPPAELSKLEPLPFVVLDPSEPFEDLARDAHAEAGERPVLIVIDSLQKLETRAGQGKGERERITAAVDAIQASQARHPAIIVATTELARGTGATKGSGSIDYGATLALKVRRTGAQIAVEVTKNRHGSELGFALALDATAQHLADPTAPKPARVDVDRGVWEQVKAVLTERGPKSRTGLEVYVRAKSDTLRAVLGERHAAGDLIHENNRYRLP